MLRQTCAALLLLALPAAAQEPSDSEAFFFGGDAYLAGTAVTLAEPGVDDVFMAGESTDLAAAITGSAHMAGRRVNINADVGASLYAAGADVTIASAVQEDATVAGYDVTIGGSIGADLRAFGSNISVRAPVGGSALLGGDRLMIDSVIAGDAAIAADEVEFGPNARIDGQVIVYGDAEDAPVVPSSVAPPERVERRDIDREIGDGGGRRTWLALGGAFVVSVLIVAILATLATAIAPLSMERLRDITDSRPFRTFLMGFLALSTLIGASIILITTLIGIFVAPVVIVLAVLLAVLGYIAAVYLVGRTLWNLLDKLPPDTFPERFLTGLIGAVVVSLVAMIPYVGPLAVLILTLTGMGALTIAVLGPEFRSDYH